MELWEVFDAMWLANGEALLYMQNGVSLHEDNHTKYQDGSLALTTHHLFYEPLEKHTATFLRLSLEKTISDASSIYSEGSAGTKISKIIVPLPSGSRLKFLFKKGGMEGFFNAFRRAIQQKSWTLEIREGFSDKSDCRSASGILRLMQISSSPSVASAGQSLMLTKNSLLKETVNNDEDQSKSVFSVTDKAGIGGLMRLSTRDVDQLHDSLHDINDVMNKASSLVAKICLLREKQNGSEKISPEDETRIESVEATLGFGVMTQPSSNILFRNKFYEDLAYELHSWMTHTNNKRVFGSRPIVPLDELFALYNKARGDSDLVAPRDVLHACRILGKQDYSQYTFKQLSSGRLALQQKDYTSLLERLVGFLGPCLCNPNSDSSTFFNVERYSIPTTTLFPTSSATLLSVNDMQLATSLQESCLVAHDLLEECEASGYLCRSGGEFGCFTFHWNIFVF